MTNDIGRQPLSPAAQQEVIYTTGTWWGIQYPDTAAPTPLLEEAMQFIERHPERHDQAAWMDRVEGLNPAADDVPVCGTAGCLAGWGIALNNPIEGQQISSLSGYVVLADRQRYVNIQKYAASLFGLTGAQAIVLFESDWTARQLRRGVDAIKANPEIGRDALYSVLLGG